MHHAVPDVITHQVLDKRVRIRLCPADQQVGAIDCFFSTAAAVQRQDRGNDAESICLSRCSFASDFDSCLSPHPAKLSERQTLHESKFRLCGLQQCSFQQSLLVQSPAVFAPDAPETKIPGTQAFLSSRNFECRSRRGSRRFKNMKLMHVSAADLESSGVCPHKWSAGTKLSLRRGPRSFSARPIAALTLRTMIIVVPPLNFRTYQILPHTNSYFHGLYSYLDLTFSRSS